MNAPSLFQFLTQAEFKLVFSLVFLEASDEFTGAYPLERYATPGSEGRSSAYGELFRRGIRFLAMEHDYKFRGMDVFENGEIMGVTLVQPENFSYVALLNGASLPDLDLALETAINMGQRVVPSLNLSPLRGMLAKVRQDKATFSEWGDAADPKNEIEAELVKLREAGMRAAGMVKTDKMH